MARTKHTAKSGPARPSLQEILDLIRANSVKNVSLHYGQFGSDGVNLLVEALEGNWSVRSLDLGRALGGSDSDARVKALASAFRKSSVEVLDLGGNHISDEGVKALAAGIPGSSLMELSLGGNEMGDDGARALAMTFKHTRLQILNLDSNNIGDGGVKALVAGIPGSPIKTLVLSSNPIGNEGAKALAAILKDSDIEELELYGTDIEEEGWKALREGVRDTAVTTLETGDDFDDEDDLSETLKQLKAVLEANRSRTFVLQLQVEGDETEWTFTFRTMAGTVAAVLNWSSDRFVQDLPEAVFEAMRPSGFQLPDRHLRAHNLRILRPDGRVLDVSDEAPPLARQLGVQRRRRLPLRSPKRRRHISELQAAQR